MNVIGTRRAMRYLSFAHSEVVLGQEYPICFSCPSNIGVNTSMNCNRCDSYPSTIAFEDAIIYCNTNRVRMIYFEK